MKTEKTYTRRKMRGWLKNLIVVLVTLLVSGGIWCLILGRGGLSLMEGWLLARYAFVDTEADLDEAVDRAMYGLVNGLGDRWSYYLTDDYYKQVAESRANQYVGIGVTVSYELDSGLLVQSVTRNGPAEAAGIQSGDVIVAVDGVPVSREDMNSATELVQGKVGTSVTLTVIRNGEQLEMVCTRGRIYNPSAHGTMLENQIGYVALINFYSGAAESFRNEVDALLDEGAESLIVDVRDDPGGYIAELEDILDYLLPEGPVLTQKPRWWFGMTTKSDADFIDLPIVVLVNSETYSAAELLAAQLRETVGAPIVGERTSGKGYSQVTFPLPNGGGLGLSTATYSTGGGHSLIGEGIVPDVELTLDDSGDDLQLAAAIEFLSR